MQFRPAIPADMDRIYMMGFDAWGEGSNQDDYLSGCRSSPKYAQGKWFVLEHDQELLSSLIVYSLDPENSIFGSDSRWHFWQ